MAGRKDKNTVDYFPHYVNHGKTLFIIESKFGNDGYAAWFKILETLGNSEHHYIDCRNDTDWEFLNAKIKLMHTSLQDVLDLCAKLGAINQKLWKNRVIFSENFVKNIEDAYNRRSSNCPTLQDIVNIIGIDANINTNNDDTNTQSKVKESKVKKNKDVDLFVSVINNALKKKCKLTEKLRPKIKKILREYELPEIEKAVNNAKADKFHIENGYKHLTPEFFTRSDKVDMWLNAKSGSYKQAEKHGANIQQLDKKIPPEMSGIKRLD